MNKNITMIPARKKQGNTKTETPSPTLRVAAYCRVSTDSDEQATSYEAQVAHYTEYIQAQKGWELAGIFADDGISGTNTKKREEFNRMIDACEAGEIDIIITKSISRFARNTLDCLKYIRRLKEINIPVFFEKENINTMDAKGEVLITIMASLAQQESQSLSQNVKLGIQYRYQQGKVQVNAKWFLGYDKDADGHLVINSEQAKTVKRIYREYLEGLSMNKIAAGLEADGIRNGAGHTKWTPSNIRQILTNEKYIGDALLQKTYTVDFLTKKRVRNEGHMPQYYVENDHEAIIPKEIFLLAQDELVRRRNLSKRSDGKRKAYSSNHCLSGLVICGECGEYYRRIHWNNRGCKSIVWRCMSRLTPGNNSCHARTVEEEFLKGIVLSAINRCIKDKGCFFAELEDRITHVIDHESSVDMKSIEQRLEDLQQMLMDRISNREPYEDVANEIDAVKEEKMQAELAQAKTDNQILRIQAMRDFLQAQTGILTTLDDALVRRMVDTITIHDKKIDVRFTSGVSVSIKQ